MAARKEIDPASGTETTGHEWDGINELNTPLPRWWRRVFYATSLGGRLLGPLSCVADVDRLHAWRTRPVSARRRR